MDFWIDVEDAAGQRLGAGPITTATDWQHTRRLDAAGAFSFSIPASDPAAALLAQRRIVRCRGLVNGVVTELGAGVIEQVERRIGEPTMVSVSGRDLMAELADSSVENLLIREQRWTFLNNPAVGQLYQIEFRESTGGIWHGPRPLARDGNLGTHEMLTLQSHHSVFLQNAHWLYVGYDSRFSAIRFTFHTPNLDSSQPTIAPQYYSSEINGWKALGVSDGTNPGNGTWKQNGVMTFGIPPDWTRYDEAVGGAGNWFWVRMRNGGYPPADPLTITALVAEVEVFAEFPTTNGVNQIMAYAPPTWRRTGYPQTVSPKYLAFQGQSVLDALRTLTEQGGQEGVTPIREHFRYAAAPREIEWLGATVTPSGVRAIAGSSTDAVTPETAIITQLTETEDTTETVTRIFAFSGDGIGLHGSTRTPPAGYGRGVSPDGNSFLENWAAIAAFGLIERWAEFGEISAQQSQTLSTHVTYTADAVHDKAVEFLRQHGVVVRQYSLSIARFAALLRPGDTIHVVYHEWVDGVRTVRIDSVADANALYILASTLRVDASGIGTIGLDVSTMDRKALTDADVVVGLARERRSDSGNVTNIIHGAVPTTFPIPDYVLTRFEDQLIYGTFQWRVGNLQAETVRIGNLANSYGYGPAALYGIGVGVFWASRPTLTLDPVNGLRLRQGTTPLIHLRADGTAMIAGWELIEGHLFTGVEANRAGLRPADFPFYAGSETPGAAPFRVTPAGALTASNATITGSITATAGAIGGWTIAAGHLFAGVEANRAGLRPADFPFYAGHETPGLAPFRVTPAGVLTARSGTLGALDIDDTITLATGGEIVSDNYAAGLTGLRIGADGYAEFQDALVRGTLHAVRFQEHVVSTVRGSLQVGQDDSVRALAAALDVPVGGGTIVFLVDSLGPAVANLEMIVIEGGGNALHAYATSDQPPSEGYVAITSSPGGFTLPVGSIVLFATERQGTLLLTADPVLRGARLVVTNADRSVQGVLGNLHGSYGIDVERYGVGIGDFATNNYLLYEPVGGLKIRGANADVQLNHLALSGDLGVRDISGRAATLSSTLGVTGAVTLSSTLAVTGAVTLSSTLAVAGDLLGRPLANNLLLNPAFDHRVAVNWGWESIIAGAVADDSTSIVGRRSLRFWVTTLAWHAVAVSHRIPVEPGQMYTATFYARCGIEGGGRINCHLDWMTRTGAHISTSALPVDTTTTWQRATGTFTSPATAAEVRIALFVTDLYPINRNAFFDGIEFRRGS